MSNNKRKRAVVLALIAFFCGATAFVSVDWKRFGGGFLAFFNPKHEPVPAYASGGTPSGGGTLGSAGDSHAGGAPLPQLVALGTQRHANSVGGGSGGHKPDDNLFKYGDPAAGAIPPGSFLVAQNDTAGNGNGGNGGAGAPAPVGGAAPETAVNPDSGDAGNSGGGVSSPAPAPGGTGGTGDGGLLFPTPSPSPAPAPSTPPVSPPPPVVSPPTSSTPPAPTPTQSGTSDQNPGSGGGDLPPVSAVPEASDAAMMGLGALFLAVAATRRRKNGAA